MTGNPLVVGPVDTATPFSGAGLLDSGAQLADAISSGNWIEGGIGAISVAVDTAATVMDPLGSLIGAGLGWLMDHFEPLKGWLNDFAGDAGEVAAFAQTWSNISAQLHGTGDELVRLLGDVDELAGEAMDAYRRFQGDAAAHLHGAGDWAAAMGVGLGIASTIVQIVHDLVRDTIAQLVGSAISWAAEAVFTLGLATPVIVGQVTSRVASLSSKVGKYVTKVIDAVRSLSKHLDSLKALFTKLKSLLDKTLPGAARSADDAAESAVRGPLQTGGSTHAPRDAPDGGWDWAEKAYEGFRANDDDIAAIARHPDNLELPNGHRLTPEELAQVKKHVMHDEHLLSDYGGGTYRSRFDANPKMAEAWYRMMEGTGSETDRLLLLHELTESNYMGAHPMATYKEAHAAADAVANWAEATGGG